MTLSPAEVPSELSQSVAAETDGITGIQHLLDKAVSKFHDSMHQLQNAQDSTQSLREVSEHFALIDLAIENLAGVERTEDEQLSELSLLESKNRAALEELHNAICFADDTAKLAHVIIDSSVRTLNQ